MIISDPSYFIDREGSGFCGGHPKIFELKGGIPKIEGGHASICTGLRGALKIFEGKLGEGHELTQYFSEIIF